MHCGILATGQRRFPDLRGAGGGVIHSRGTPFLLHKYGLPLLPAARRLGYVSFRRLVSRRRFGQLPLLPVVISCQKTRLRPSPPRRCSGKKKRGARLTVFGFGLKRAVLGTLVRHQNRTEEVGTALQLQARLPAEVRDLVRQSGDLEGGAVRLPFISGGRVFTCSPAGIKELDALAWIGSAACV